MRPVGWASRGRGISIGPGPKAMLTNGYAVTATDSALGVPKLLPQVQPHVVMLDLGLPYESGASLLRSLKADPEKLAELNARYGLEMQPETVPELLERFGLRIGEPLSGGWTPLT